MVDREKVLKGLRCLARTREPTSNPCKDCGYIDRPNFAMCVVDVAIDALELLKEQEEQIKHLSTSLRLRNEPVKPYKSRKNIKYPYSCGNCACYLQPTWRACPMCGSKVKWK